MKEKKGKLKGFGLRNTDIDLYLYENPGVKPDNDSENTKT